MQALMTASRNFPALRLQFLNNYLHSPNVPLATTTSSSFSFHTSRRSLSSHASASVSSSKRHRRVLSPHHYQCQYQYQYQCGDPSSSSSSIILTNPCHNRHNHLHHRHRNYNCRRYTTQTRARGYLAGLHCSVLVSEETEYDKKTPPEFPSFVSAWEAIQQVPEELIKQFEDDLWNSESKRFVYGSKSVSVIDAIIEASEIENAHTSGGMEEGEESGSDINKKNTKNANTVFRYLILNERPNLVQTAVEIAHIGAPYNPHFHHDQSFIGRSSPSPSPSPISQTHLGGLAMVLPLWYKANARAHNARAHSHAHAQIDAEINNEVKKNVGNNEIPETCDNDDTDCKKLEGAHLGGAPNCVLIGAGGCSLAHTLAVNLYLNHNQPLNRDSDSDSDCDGNKNKEHGERSDNLIQSKSISESTSSIPIPIPIPTPTPTPIAVPLTAIEACPEILHVAQKWFGAGDGSELRNKDKGIGEHGHQIDKDKAEEKYCNHGDDDSNERQQEQQRSLSTFSPPYFHLLHDTGESYLKSLALRQNYKNDKCGGHRVGGERDPSLIDVLIIDAEDGSAPPQSMRTLEFWQDTVLPVLNFETNENAHGSITSSAGTCRENTTSARIDDSWGSCGPIVGVNVIDSQREIQDLIETMRQSFQYSDGVYKDYTVLEVSPPPGAKVSERHKLLFALPTETLSKKDHRVENNCNDHNKELGGHWDKDSALIISGNDLEGYVDVPAEWAYQLQLLI